MYKYQSKLEAITEKEADQDGSILRDFKTVVPFENALGFVGQVAAGVLAGNPKCSAASAATFAYQVLEEVIAIHTEKYFMTATKDLELEAQMKAAAEKQMAEMAARAQTNTETGSVSEQAN